MRGSWIRFVADMSGYALIKPLEETLVSDVLDALNPPENDERLRPKSCKREPTRVCSAHLGMQRLNERVRQTPAARTLAGLVGTMCSDLEQPDSESGVALACVTQGESGP